MKACKASGPVELGVLVAWNLKMVHGSTYEQ